MKPTITRRPWESVASANGQVMLLFLLLAAGTALIFMTVDRDPFSTVLVLGLVSSVGLWLCWKAERGLRDTRLRVLGYFWLIKLGMTLFLLYVGWIPELDPWSSDAWGYDPQRYYVQAQELIEAGWSPDFLSLNYIGILYYYGALMYILGRNPVIPALANALVTLLATLYLVKTSYEIKPDRSPHDWTLAYALLLPELLWFDVMTSRETLLAALLLCVMLTIGRYFAKTAPLSIPRVVMVSGLCLLAITAFRPVMIVPVFASLVLMVVLVGAKSGPQLVGGSMLVLAVAGLLVVAPLATVYLGGYEFDWYEVARARSFSSENFAGSSDVNWSDRSIGMLLLPEGPLQAMLFLPLRMILYLVAPLPNVMIEPTDLLAGSWWAWQKLLLLLSAILNVLAIPYAAASLTDTVKKRTTQPGRLVFHVPYWITFASIAGGNLIIHERYRVMATLLMWGCAWLGARTCRTGLTRSYKLFWYGGLVLGMLLYVGYKGRVL